MNNKINRFVWGILLLPSLCSATNFGGEWGNTLYLTKDRIDTVRPFVSGYENINLHAVNINGSNISLFTNLNATNGFADSLRKKVEVAHLYLDWKNIGNHLDARVGRQTDYEGFRVKNFDGAKLLARINRNCSVSGFGGITVPSRFSESYVQVNNDTAHYIAGAKAAARFAATDIAVSAEDDQGPDNSETRTVGLDLAQSIGKAVSLRGSGVYNLSEESVADYQVRLTVDPSEKFSFDASVYANNEKPDTTDIFSVKIFKTYRQVSTSVTWFCRENASLSGGYVLRLLEGDNTNHEAAIHYDHPLFSAGFVQDVGYGGSNSEGDISVRFFSNRPLRIEIGGSTMYYKTEFAAKSELAYVGRAAVLYRPSSSWLNGRLEVQQLHNKFYASDTRVLLTTQIRFSKFTAQ